MKLILGTMTFGERLFGQETIDITSRFLETGNQELDTAYVYNEGASERLLGAALQCTSNHAKVATKANPRVTGKLDKEAVIMQLNGSLERMGVEKIDTFYLHFPDAATPVESALEACAQLYSEGKFSRLGLSNFPAWMVSEVYHICKSNGWVTPTVYQGLYNPLSRLAENELKPALNYYGMSFYAYNPLAGGLLTNKYSTADRELKEGRFVNRPNYQQRYWKDSYFQAVEIIRSACQQHNMDIVEATYRWLSYHSMLDETKGDGIIVGLSKISQLEQNMQSIQKGQLPLQVQEAFAKGWEICHADAPSYFKYYNP